MGNRQTIKSPVFQGGVLGLQISEVLDLQRYSIQPTNGVKISSNPVLNYTNYSLKINPLSLTFRTTSK